MRGRDSGECRACQDGRLMARKSQERPRPTAYFTCAQTHRLLPPDRGCEEPRGHDGPHIINDDEGMPQFYWDPLPPSRPTLKGSDMPETDPVESVEMINVPRRLLAAIRCDLLLAYSELERPGPLKDNVISMLRRDRAELLTYAPYQAGDRYASVDPAAELAELLIQRMG